MTADNFLYNSFLALDAARHIYAMNIPRTTKLRQRRSVFGLWIPTKVVPFDSRLDPSPTDSAISDTPSSDPITIPCGSRDRLKVRFSRSRSKILYLFGLGGTHIGQFKYPITYFVGCGN